MYHYYLTQRPPGIGTYPIMGATLQEEALTIASHAYSNRECWKVTYESPLKWEDIYSYELMPDLSGLAHNKFPYKKKGSDGVLRDKGFVQVVSTSNDGTVLTLKEIAHDGKIIQPEYELNSRAAIIEYPVLYLAFWGMHLTPLFNQKIKTVEFPSECTMFLSNGNKRFTVGFLRRGPMFSVINKGKLCYYNNDTARAITTFNNL